MIRELLTARKHATWDRTQARKHADCTQTARKHADRTQARKHATCNALTYRFTICCPGGPKAEPELLRIAKRFNIQDAVVMSEFKAWLRSQDDLQAKYLFPEHVFRPSIIHSSSPLDWWQDNGHLLPALQQVALFVLSICPHAAGAERTWSLNSTEPLTCAFRHLLAICSRARLWAPPPFFSCFSKKPKTLEKTNRRFWVLSG